MSWRPELHPRWRGDSGAARLLSSARGESSLRTAEYTLDEFDGMTAPDEDDLYAQLLGYLKLPVAKSEPRDVEFASEDDRGYAEVAAALGIRRPHSLEEGTTWGS